VKLLNDYLDGDGSAPANFSKDPSLQRLGYALKLCKELTEALKG